ncbi:MAG: hypothetical protein ACI8S6_001581 [Myxococcota bacterium]|jgi:hypothetical protein
MHLWTNAVRVDPEAFSADYELGGCSFSSFSADERTPKAPIYYNRDLNTVARLHSEDMRDNDFFSHSSSDGTSFSARVGAWYATSFIGENIAWGYANSEVVVVQGWMCSTEGHRQNIMSGDWTELGTGAASELLHPGLRRRPHHRPRPRRHGLPHPQTTHRHPRLPRRLAG